MSFPMAGRGRIVRGEDPEPTVMVRSLVNGATIPLRVSHAATLVMEGEAEVIGDMEGETRERFDQAVAHLANVPAVERQVT